jgi:hypothetical protein
MFQSKQSYKSIISVGHLRESYDKNRKIVANILLGYLFYKPGNKKRRKGKRKLTSREA